MNYWDAKREEQKSTAIKSSVAKLHVALRSIPLGFFGITTARVSKGRYNVSWRDYRSSVPCGKSSGLLVTVPERNLIEVCAVLVGELQRVRAAARKRRAA